MYVRMNMMVWCQSRLLDILLLSIAIKLDLKISAFNELIDDI